MRQLYFLCLIFIVNHSYAGVIYNNDYYSNCESILMTTFEGDLVIGNQSELNALDSTIDVIDGNLIINSDGSDDIFDLSVFSNLVSITGTLTISNNPILSELTGLNSLTTISGGTITIENNLILYNYCALSNVGGSITATITENSYNPTFAEILGNDCSAADVIFTGDLTVISQSEIDALPQYTQITGRLDILGGDGDISDLSNFSKLRDIGGRLLIQDCPLLLDLNGLNALEIVGSASVQEFAIRRMDGLLSLNGLQALRTVSRRIGVWENPVLRSLEGLNNLQLIRDNAVSAADGLIRIGTTAPSGANPSLVDFCALSGIIDIIGAPALDADPLSYINNYTTFNPSFQDISNGICTSVFTGDLTVTTQAEINSLPVQYTHITGRLDILGGDGDISDLSKFSELKDIGGRLLIQDCPLITDLTGLSSLEIIGSASSQELAIRRMDGLLTLDGLQSLKTVSRRIGVWENPVLTTLEGLNNLELIRDNMVSGTDGLIRIGTTNPSGANPSLTDFCALSGIIDIIGAAALDADALSYINNYTPFNPTFQEISSGNCQAELSVNEFVNLELNIYPNPVNALLEVNSNHLLDSIRILNYLGVELLRTKDTSIDLSHLSSGMYFVEVTTGHITAVKKIIKN